MGWKVKMVIGLRFNQLPFALWGPNLPNQNYWSTFTKPKLLNESTKQNFLNVKNKIYRAKYIQSNQQNQFYQSKCEETKSTDNQSKVQFQLELSLAQFSPRLSMFKIKKNNFTLPHTGELTLLPIKQGWHLPAPLW